MENDKQQATLTYIGPPGSGLGMQLAGMTVIDCTNSDLLVQELRRLKREQSVGIIYVDEGLAEEVLDDVEKLNDDPMPAIVLLINPTKPRRLAAEKMNRLMIRAIGSDIFDT